MQYMFTAAGASKLQQQQHNQSVCSANFAFMNLISQTSLTAFEPTAAGMQTGTPAVR